MGDKIDVKSKLLEGREQIEGNFVFALWKEPLMFGDYEKSIDIRNDLLLNESKFYYGIGYAMFKEGYTTLDDTSVSLFLSDKNKLREQFEEYGGYKTVEDIIDIVNIEDIDVYYDKLTKNNILINLDKQGFNIADKLDQFKLMSSDDVYDYYEFLLTNIMVDKVSKIKTVDLATGYNQYLDKWDSGVGVGFPVAFPMLNYHLAGIHKKNLILHLAPIGGGKTTSAILTYVLPTIKAGEKVCIIANEQDEEEWRQMLLSTVLSNEIGYFGMNRQKLLFGGFTEQDKIHIKQAIEWLEQYADQIQFAELSNYDITNVKRIIKRHSKLGTGLFVFDTLKPEDDSNDKAWGEFSELAKELFLIAKDEDVAVVATAQLASSASKRRFLDLSCIGKSRAIAETAGQVVMFRPMRQKEKESIKVFTYKKGSDGRYQKMTEEKKIHDDRDYIMLFVPKNRYGKAGDLQIVYERNMDFNTIKEIGYCHIEYDGFE